MVEELAVAGRSVVHGAVPVYLDTLSALCDANALRRCGTQVDDLFAAGNVIVALAHPQVGSYIESFEIDVAV